MTFGDDWSRFPEIARGELGQADRGVTGRDLDAELTLGPGPDVAGTVLRFAEDRIPCVETQVDDQPGARDRLADSLDAHPAGDGVWAIRVIDGSRRFR